MKQEQGIWGAPLLALFCRMGYQDDCPFITPDGKRVFFLSRRPLEPGGPLADRENIWFAARKGDSWGEPEYLGDAICLNEVIGCPTASQCTTLTPDGKYLFYISWGFDEWAAYWVKSDFIDKLRPKD